MGLANELWLEDMSLKLLCVFALDRFGDFVTDEVAYIIVRSGVPKHLSFIKLSSFCL